MLNIAFKPFDVVFYFMAVSLCVRMLSMVHRLRLYNGHHKGTVLLTWCLPGADAVEHQRYGTILICGQRSGGQHAPHGFGAVRQWPKEQLQKHTCSCLQSNCALRPFRHTHRAQLRDREISAYTSCHHAQWSQVFPDTYKCMPFWVVDILGTRNIVHLHRL